MCTSTLLAELKVCTICGIPKPLQDYVNRTASKDGKDYECRPCMARRRDHRHDACGIELKAADIICSAVRNNTIDRPETCEECGHVCKTLPYHLDYDDLLKVRWLCSLCYWKETTDGKHQG